MCLIVHKPKGKTVPLWIIESALKYSEDGVGIMHSGKAARWVRISANKIKKRMDKLTDVEAAIHFRMATHGDITKANVHPFRLANNAFLMHNGIFNQYAPKEKIKSSISDTRHFVDKFCNPQIAVHGNIPKKKLDKEIGYTNAVAIMDKAGSIKKYGFGWLEYEGLSFSNEYAWDYPHAINPLYDNDAKLGFGRGSYAVAPPYKGYQTIDGLVSEQLQKYAEFLPLDTANDVAYEDMDLYDKLYAGQIDTHSFLRTCTAETALRLYNWCVERSFIDPRYRSSGGTRYV